MRSLPVQATAARLIYRDWQRKMVLLGHGDHIFDWDEMPGDAKEAFIESVSSTVNYFNRSTVQRLADGLGVSLTEFCCPNGHRPARVWPGPDAERDA